MGVSEGEVAGGEGGETRAAPAASTVEGGGDEGGGGGGDGGSLVASLHNTLFVPLCAPPWFIACPRSQGKQADALLCPFLSCA